MKSINRPFWTWKPAENEKWFDMIEMTFNMNDEKRNTGFVSRFYPTCCGSSLSILRSYVASHFISNYFYQVYELES